MARSRVWQESFAWPEDGGGPVTFPLLFDLVEMAEPWPEGGLSWSQEDYRDCPERFEVRLSFVRRGEELRLDLGFDPGSFRPGRPGAWRSGSSSSWPGPWPIPRSRPALSASSVRPNATPCCAR